ncbi:MAG: type III polyketide synthase [Alphaproteobacteria bacterium]|nr:type III polyketide synthase [Alphaproteobacteria bacterium]
MTNAPRLLGLSTALPPFTLRQAEIERRARGYFAGAAALDLDRLMPVFANAGIETRYSCVPLEWYDRPHGWTERNELYLDHAVRLLERATRNCLSTAALTPAQIDAVVTVSTTGIATPSLDARLLNRLGFRSDVIRLPVFGLGCAGGVAGLARAADLARARPGANVLVLVVELCALCFRRGDNSKSNVVATALFGDGAAAAVMSTAGDGPRLGPAGEHTWPDSLGVMGWDVMEDGLKAIFSRDIPALVRSELRAAVDAFLARHRHSLTAIDHVVCHPGGMKVLSAIEEAFALAPHALDHARAVLRECGNMSAATVLFVLDRTLKAGARGRMLLSALGPGFTAGFLVLEA